MAYDASKETVEILGMFDKNSRGDKVGVKKITNNNNGNVSLDIRLHFTNDAEEIMPTSKGVRVNAEMAADIIKAALNVLEQDELMNIKDSIDEMLDEADGDD